MGEKRSRSRDIERCIDLLVDILRDIDGTIACLIDGDSAGASASCEHLASKAKRAKGHVMELRLMDERYRDAAGWHDGDGGHDTEREHEEDKDD